ncbi:DUF4129 domain-containing protein [Kitasatospora sp. NPDC057692]|uniref:DUF4129 domain-containing protein n=1 Tax=Kitasatospora sp. NPDC057692 TaxID=3346215 RepID=UPI00369454DD
MTEDVSPDRLRPRPTGGGAAGGRTVPLLLVGGGLLLAAAALRPGGGVLGTPGDPVVGSTGLVVLLALGWAGLVGRFAARFRAEVRSLTGPTPRAERLREAAVLLVAGAAALVPLLALLLHSRVREPAGPEERRPGIPPEAAPTEPPQDGPPADDGNLLAPLLYVLVVVLAVLLLVALVRMLLRRYRVPWRVRALPGVVIGGVPGEDALAAAVATGRRSLHGADARAAVIACYAAMEGSLAASGLERRVSDNPAELLERAVADDRVDRAPAYALTELFREARYSSHPMDDGHVRRARAALDAIAARLAAAGEQSAAGDPAAAGEPAASDRTGRPAPDRTAAPRSHR